MKTKKLAILAVLGLLALTGCKPKPPGSSEVPSSSEIPSSSEVASSSEGPGSTSVSEGDEGSKSSESIPPVVSSSEQPSSEVPSSEVPSSEEPSSEEPSSSEIIQSFDDGSFAPVYPTDYPAVTNGANGLKNYSAVSYAEKEKILGQLEGYVLDNFLGGIPFADNGGSVMYHPRLTIPSNTYVPGYGFGVGEGTIAGPLPAGKEPETKYAMYYHTWQQKDPGTINYWDGQDSVTSDLHSMVSSSYWSTRFNEDKTGYEWYPQLAVEDRPEAIDPDSTGRSTKWFVKVKTDATIKYDTLSAKPGIAAYKGRQVVLEDYLTPFKAMLQGNLFRATDLGNASGGFKGVQQYVKEYAEGKNPSWDNVGIQLDVARGGLLFDFNTPKTPFYAMYNLSSSLFSPVPQSFIEDIGGLENYGKPNIDSILSLGMYTLEEWQTDKQLAFKKNQNFFEKDRATHEGYKYTMLADNITAFQEFLDGKLDSAGIPGTYLKEYKNDPRTRRTLGETIWKLQVNSTDSHRWEELFGVNGTIKPHAKGDYWKLKPALSNKDFLNGLYYSLDRKTLADNNSRNPAHGFLGDAYMIDPEEGVSFRSSDAGKAVLAGRAPETFGFSLEAANQFFNKAMTSLIAEGKYVRGTTAAPTVIALKLIYQTVAQVADEGQVVKQQLETAFNNAVDGFKLVIEPYATADWMDAYNKPRAGEFDLAFGSISGNTLDPVSFMDTVLDNNRTGFTLSYGARTNQPTETIEYDGLHWSYQGLLDAAVSGAVLKDGAGADLFGLDNVYASPADVDGGFIITAKGTYYAEDPENVKLAFVALIVYGDTAEIELDLDDESVTITFAPDGTWTIVIDFPGEHGIAGDDYLDLTMYYQVTLAGSTGPEQGVYLEFSIPAAAE